jgi:hypothetical protein
LKNNPCQKNVFGEIRYVLNPAPSWPFPVSDGPEEKTDHIGAEEKQASEKQLLNPNATRRRRRRGSRQWREEMQRR